MFDKGEYIVYGSTGICMIEEITTMNMPDVPQDRLYYVMEPCGQKGRRIYAPVENPKMKLRRVLTKEEVLELIKEIPSIEQMEISEEKQREQRYKEYLRSCECRDWIRMIKTLYYRQQERVSRGKKITVTDERYFRQAEDYLYTEFSISLGMPKQEVSDFIKDKIKELELQEA